MGTVFLAHDTKLDRAVAIKFLDGFQTNPASRQRFLIEARAIARLTHPNVVGVYRIGEIFERPYLVSEFIYGKSLDRLPLPLRWEHALGIALHLCSGLSASHRRGVLHRDLKPANVILTEDASVKLLDFGLAKLLDAALPSPVRPSCGSGSVLRSQERAQPSDRVQTGPSGLPSPELTRSGAQLGTPLYMAPEAWRGEPATARTDIYSLGVVLYELCTGRLPHTADTALALGMRVVHRDAAPLCSVAPAVDPRFGAIVDRCLRRSPADRFPSVDDVHSALLRISGQKYGDGLLSVPETASAPRHTPFRERRPRFLAAAVLSMLVLGGGVLAMRRILPPGTRAVPAAERADVPPPARPATAAPESPGPPAAAPASAVLRYHVPLGSAAIAGPADAKVTIVEYSDYVCPHCAKAGPVLAQLRRAYPSEVRIAFKYYPLKSVPYAHESARAAMAAREQGEDKFWAYHQKLFENQTRIDAGSFERFARELGLDTVGFKTDLTENRARYDRQIASDRAEGARLGLHGVPTFFVNGRLLRGPATGLKKLVAEELAAADAALRTGIAPGELYVALTRDGLRENKPISVLEPCCSEPIEQRFGHETRPPR